MPPLVSVIIPTFNRAIFLTSAIESVLAQTVRDIELIVVDDGSTDETAELVKRYLADPRVRYVYQENQGRSLARNHGVTLAQGEYVGFLDSDDCYLLTALETHLRMFASQSEIGMTVGGYEYVDERGRRLGERCPWEEGGQMDIEGWLFNCFGMPGAVLIRREWFESTAGFDASCEMAEDWGLYLQLAALHCSMEWVPEAVCRYRQHPGGSVHGLVKHRDGSLRALEKFFCRPDLPAEIAAMRSEALAWVYVVFARKAYASGQIAQAVQDLEKAIQLNPTLAGRERISLIEFLLTWPEPAVEGKQNDLASRIVPHFPRELNLRRGDIRRALARVQMARFFRAVGKGARTEALLHLKAGLRQDPTWLANRGVIAFFLKQVFRTGIGRRREPGQSHLDSGGL